MTTFVNEQVKRLNTILTQSFEKQLQENSIKDFSCLNEKDQFLYQTTQAIDLNNSLPSFEKIQHYLEKYDSFANNAGTLEAADPSLEWLFVAKCTIAVYGQVFSNILNLTLPISESIDYWNNIHGNTLNEIYYALQVAPARIYSLLKNTLMRLENTNLQSFNNLFTFDYVLSQLFPIHTNKHIQSNTNSKSFHLSKYFNLSSFHHRPVFFEILSDEIHLRKKSLQQFRSEQAASLGVLLLTPPQFQNDTSDFTEVLSKETKSCIEMIKYVLEPVCKKETKEKNVHHLQQHLSSMDLSPMSAQSMTIELNNIVKTWSNTYNQRLQSIQSLYGIPSAFTRYWIPGLISYMVGSWAIRYGFQHQQDIVKGVEEFGKTAYDFALNWVWEPILKVYHTIRLKDQRLSLLSKEGLQSDLDSLERMVVEFARDNLHLTEQELSLVAAKVKEGDISVLLREYEKEIKSPVKNAIIGHLLQTIFIQVQKVKVDVDLAMSALDKLLKSNELNFAFLAVAPSMLLTYASASWFKNTIQGRSIQKMKKTGMPIKETLRRIERQLIMNEPVQKGELSEWKVVSLENQDMNQQHQMECETQGILLCEIHLLRAYAHSLPRQNAIRARFIEDIRDLENPSLSNEQKIQTVARIHRFWNF